MRLAVLLLACFALASAAPIPAVDSSDVASFLTQLALNDDNRPKSGQVVVAYQNQASGKTFDHDNAPNPLFTSVDAELLGEHTYKSFTDLIAQFPSQDANVADPETAERKDAALGFIDDISLTSVFMQAWSYLNTAGVASGDYNEFRDQLYIVWFSVFARDKVAGSSGFKSTFVGEYQSDAVVGLTNWIRFSQLEAVKGVNYHGWFAKQPDVQVQLQFGLEVPVGEKQAFRSNLLLNTSPEFEFMAYAVCALTGNSACKLMIAGNEVALNVDTVTVDGNRVISVAYPSIGDVSATTTKKPTTPKASIIDAELQALVDSMRAQDDDKPASAQYLLSWGDKLGKNPKPSGKDLLSNVDESLFAAPVYAALQKVYDNGILVPDVCVSESDYNSGFKRSILQSLLDTWSTTRPFALMHDFLVGRVAPTTTTPRATSKIVKPDSASTAVTTPKRGGASTVITTPKPTVKSTTTKSSRTTGSTGIPDSMGKSVSTTPKPTTAPTTKYREPSRTIKPTTTKAATKPTTASTPKLPSSPPKTKPRPRPKPR